MRILSQSQSAEKLGRGDPLGFSKLQFAVKYQKNLKGEPFGDKKKFEKKSHSAEKNSKADPKAPTINWHQLEIFGKKGKNVPFLM